MGHIGMIGAAGIGVIIALAPAVLVWALVAAGLHRMLGKKKHARTDSMVAVDGQLPETSSKV